MMYKAWHNIEEVPFRFFMSSIKFQGHTRQKIADFDPNWALPDSNSSFNSQMILKWCPIVFLGHPSNFKVTQAEKSMILTQFE